MNWSSHLPLFFSWFSSLVIAGLQTGLKVVLTTYLAGQTRRPADHPAKTSLGRLGNQPKPANALGQNSLKTLSLTKERKVLELYEDQKITCYFLR